MNESIRIYEELKSFVMINRLSRTFPKPSTSLDIVYISTPEFALSHKPYIAFHLLSASPKTFPANAVSLNRLR
jgi:hypothetical protein